MKHLCDTFKDYIDAINTSMEDDIIYCSETLRKELNVRSQLIFVFSGVDFYPCGGYEDFKRSFTTIEEAKEWTETNLTEEHGMDQWVQIVSDHKIIIRGIISGYGSSVKWEWERLQGNHEI